jgi:hypothetical protein
LASCPNCGTDARDGAWTCGTCGSPLGQPAAADTYQEPVYDKAYYDAPTAYGTTAPTIQPLRAGKTSSGSKLPWLVVLAIVAIATVAGVWFFVLKPAPGAQFLGTWHGSESAPAGSLAYTVTIARNGALYLVTETAGKKNIGPFSATLKNGHLESTYDYVGQDATQAAAVAAAKNMEALVYKDFKVVFTVDQGTLAIAVQGSPKSPGSVTVTESTKLTKAD